MKNKFLLLLFLIGPFLFAGHFGLYKIPFFRSSHVSEEAPLSGSRSEVVSKKEGSAKLFSADIPLGVVGIVKADEVDAAYDNVFHITIDQLPGAHENAYLEYELFGYDQAASVSRSLNNQPSIGGHFLSPNASWTRQSELLSESSLRSGDNVLLFTAPEGVSNAYKIRNVQIVYKNATTQNRFTLLQAENKLYVKGTGFPSQIKRMTIGGIAVDVHQPEFEVILDADEYGASIVVTTETITGSIVNEELKVHDFLKVARFRSFEHAAASMIKTLDFKCESTIVYKDFSVVFPAGALQSTVNLSARGLRRIDLAPLNASMVNVTAGHAGFRLLPHGTLFEKPVALSLPYDKEAIPEGYTEKDIRVFYFDEYKRLWQEVPTDSLLASTSIIRAQTTHFTDFIAGIIKMPESPETSGYTPTSIKDLKAASPLVGVQSIAPPSANARGTAGTGFSIVIPAGRGGMQPSLALQYDSDGGHSWAGLGWDISVPSVSIETRWGAPRYDASRESESYILAGEALIPNAHRATWEARSSNKQFYPRREGAFQQIIRNGSSPKNYYWVVKDKSGVVSYYGGNKSGLAPNAVLQDASGNIGHWGLCLQVDLRGNTISYEYDKRDGELYLKKIYYTGFGTDKGNYSVTFVKNADLGEGNRPDVQVSARLGFRQLNDQLLRRIEVRYKNALVRSYELHYEPGAFKKTLLKSISEYDAENTLFYTNTLDYFDDVRDAGGQYNPFGPEQSWSVPSDNLDNPGIPAYGDVLFSGKHSLVSSSEGNTKGVNYRLGVGLTTNLGSLKGFTVGGHGGNSRSKSQTAVLLEDLDGDGLPDKVFRNNTGVYYRKNLSASGQYAFGEMQALNIGELGYSESTSFNWGVDLDLKYANVGYDQQRSTNKTKIYFMDFNGDGLVDFVRNGKVHYNRLEDGVPAFHRSSTGTPSPVSGGGGIAVSGSGTISTEEIEKQNPLHDVVRMWEAPAAGVITVSHEYRLLPESTPEATAARTEYVTNAGIDKADGVRLYFQKGNALLWDEAIGATDHAVKTKQDIDISVAKGERLYFRVSAVRDGNFDAVSWEPVITYSRATQYTRGANGTIVASDQTIAPGLSDVNLYSLSTYRVSTDFFSSSGAGKVIPVAGNVLLKGMLNKPVTSDHIRLVITKHYLGQDTPPPPVVLFEKTFPAGEAATFELSSVSLPAF